MCSVSQRLSFPSPPDLNSTPWGTPKVGEKGPRALALPRVRTSEAPARCDHVTPRGGPTRPPTPGVDAGPVPPRGGWGGAAATRVRRAPPGRCRSARKPTASRRNAAARQARPPGAGLRTFCATSISSRGPEASPRPSETGSPRSPRRRAARPVSRPRGAAGRRPRGPGSARSPRGLARPAPRGRTAERAPGPRAGEDPPAPHLAGSAPPARPARRPRAGGTPPARRGPAFPGGARAGETKGPRAAPLQRRAAGGGGHPRRAPQLAPNLQSRSGAPRTWPPGHCPRGPRPPTRGGGQAAAEREQQQPRRRRLHVVRGRAGPRALTRAPWRGGGGGSSRGSRRLPPPPSGAADQDGGGGGRRRGSGSRAASPPPAPPRPPAGAPRSRPAALLAPPPPLGLPGGRGVGVGSRARGRGGGSGPPPSSPGSRCVTCGATRTRPLPMGKLRHGGGGGAGAGRGKGTRRGSREPGARSVRFPATAASMAGSGPQTPVLAREGRGGSPQARDRGGGWSDAGGAGAEGGGGLEVTVFDQIPALYVSGGTRSSRQRCSSKYASGPSGNTDLTFGSGSEQGREPPTHRPGSVPPAPRRACSSALHSAPGGGGGREGAEVRLWSC